MALSAYQKGRMLLISADKAPATGCILFESVDSGRSWVNISDDVADATAALTDHAPEILEHTPLAMFVPGAPRWSDSGLLSAPQQQTAESDGLPACM